MPRSAVILPALLADQMAIFCIKATFLTSSENYIQAQVHLPVRQRVPHSEVLLATLKKQTKTLNMWGEISQTLTYV